MMIEYVCVLNDIMIMIKYKFIDVLRDGDV